MIERRAFEGLPSEELGGLKTRRHFSSTGNSDPAADCWGCMRVWNDEEIAPDAGLELQVHANIDLLRPAARLPGEFNRVP